MSTSRIQLSYPFRIDPFRFISENDDASLSFFNSNDPKGKNMITWGKRDELKRFDSDNAFEKLKEFKDSQNDLMLGYLAYDLKNDIEDLSSENHDDLGFPVLHFYIPELIIELFENETCVSFHQDFPQEKINKMIYASVTPYDPGTRKGLKSVIHGMEEADYENKFNSLQSHIQQGDIYEVNYCLSFYANEMEIDPLPTYWSLNEQTKAPFSVFHKDEEHYLLCGSPERYLKKEGDKVISQPIKGTTKRGRSKDEDELLKEKLRNDPKERGENVMIVDLVRNDLSRIAQKDSVRVDELFGVYTFESVHQLISTVSCNAKKDIHVVDIIKATFPMGSMTGAPKIRAMKLIEENESFKRGLYSGAFGYIEANGDFDFNVIIRSILYNKNKKSISFPVGGALTSLAKSHDEYHECILKAKAMKKALQNH